MPSTIKKGLGTGPHVERFQELLKEHGYITLVDESTLAREQLPLYIEFQSANNLTADGIVGPSTWAALEVGR